MIECLVNKTRKKWCLITSLSAEKKHAVVRRKKEEKNKRVLYSEKSAVCLSLPYLLEHSRLEKIRNEEDTRKNSALANERDRLLKLNKEMEEQIKFVKKAEKELLEDVEEDRRRSGRSKNC